MKLFLEFKILLQNSFIPVKYKYLVYPNVGLKHDNDHVPMSCQLVRTLDVIRAHCAWLTYKSDNHPSNFNIPSESEHTTGR